MACTAAAKRSWAQLVKGVEAPACSPDTDSFEEDVLPVSQPSPTKPSTRGSRQSWCRGEFLMMAGHYGWIMSLDSIDHPDAGKHGGDIYVAKRDLRGKTFKKGDIVGFYLYADDQGLGAESCVLIQEAAESDTEDNWAGGWTKGWADSEADGWVNGWANSWADWDNSVPVVPVFPVARTMNPHVAEFVPKAASMNPLASEFVPTANTGLPKPEHTISTFNPACLSDDSSDEALSPSSRKASDSVSGGSTSAGEELSAMSADSGTDGEAEPMPAPIPFRPPPGLALPPPWRRGQSTVWGRLATEPMTTDSESSEQDTSLSTFRKEECLPPWLRHAKSTLTE